MTLNSEPPVSVPLEITVQELKNWRDQNHPHVLLDIREPDEREIANIGGLFIPMMSLPEQLSTLEPESEIVVYCHHGNRSLRVTHFLRQNGYSKVSSLKGGIEEWSLTIDPTVPRY